jgi:hypothetical protein
MAQAIIYLAQFNIKSDKVCWGALKYLLRYLDGTPTKGIIFKLYLNSIIINEENNYI